MGARRNRTGAGDPEATVRLLWRARVEQPKRRGPAPAISVDRLVDLAVEIADRDGLDAVTMRRLAEAAGLAPMGVYRYVPSRDVLIDLMYDRACEATADGLRRDTLSKSLEAIAKSNREMYRAHPWAAAVVTSRPAVGPGQTRKYEVELSALADWGLGDLEMDAALVLLVGFVRANFREAEAQARAITESGMTDEEWWNLTAPQLAEVMDPSEFPLAHRVGSATGEAHGSAADAGYAYRYGLQRIIAGIAAAAGVEPAT